MTRASCPACTRAVDDQIESVLEMIYTPAEAASRTMRVPIRTSGTRSGVTPTCRPSMLTFAPRGLESTKIDPVNDSDGDSACGRELAAG